MPKRYRVVSGSDFTWEYIDDDKEPWVLLAESYETYATKEEAKAAIGDMKKAEVKDGRDGRQKPPRPPR